jgi:cell filamentation protein
MNKISIRFYKDHKVRAVWDEGHNQWWFSVLDVLGAINATMRRTEITGNISKPN